MSATNQIVLTATPTLPAHTAIKGTYWMKKEDASPALMDARYYVSLQTLPNHLLSAIALWEIWLASLKDLEVGAWLKIA